MWTCEVCKTEHHWMNDVCDHCSAFNGSTEFQWMCGPCQTDNVLLSDQCKSCDSKRQWKYVGDYNWECIECNNINSFNDKKCRKCKIKGPGFVRLKVGKIQQCRMDEHSIGGNPYCALCNVMVYPYQQIADLSCGHVFHTRCFLNWATSGNENASKCPHCRVDIPFKRITHLVNATSEEEDSCCECCGGEVDYLYGK